MSIKNDIKIATNQRKAFFLFLKEISNFRKIDIKDVKQILEESFVKTIQKKFDPEAEIELIVDFENEEFRLVNKKALVVSDENYKEDLKEEEGMKVSEISISEARLLYGKNIEIDDEIQIDIDFETLPKSIFTPVQQQFKQKIAEIVRIGIFQKYQPLKGQTIKAKLVSVLRSGFLYEIEEDKVNAFMPKQLASNKKPKLGIVEDVYIEDVLEEVKDTQVIISNSSNQILKELIQREIPEIQNGEIEIVRIVRQPGKRSKVAVQKSSDADNEGLTTIGTLIGQNGNRISNISNELDGEKIDIIEYSENIETFIINALSPSRVISIQEQKQGKIKKYLVIVPDSHNTIAIGRGGLNVALAADLTRNKIDIISYSKAISEKIKFVWNGNVENEDEMQRIDIAKAEEIKNNSLNRHSQNFSYNRRNNNFFSKSNIMAEFERDIAKYQEDLETMYINDETYPSSIPSETTNKSHAKKTNKEYLDVDQIMEDAIADFKESSFVPQQNQNNKKEISYTQEEMKQIQEEIENYKMDNDLASFTGLKNFDFDINDAAWDDEEEEEE